MEMTMTEAPTVAPGWSGAQLPFHEGELAAQERAGVLSVAASIGRRGIRDYMPDQHREFYAQLPFMVVGGVDAEGQPWATLRVGEPGFVSSPDARTLRIGGGALPGDPLAGTWRRGSRVGGLGIQLETRRRNRVNGIVTAIEGDALTLTVSQSFGNCPKYIQSRTPMRVSMIEDEAAVEYPRVAAQLNDADHALLQRADTFFIASANVADEAGSARGVDVSHRGGLPGFVRVDDAVTLTTPDFSGNRLFNTIGNLLVEPRAGLLFIDFESGDLLYVAADAEIVWEAPELSEFPGAQRLVRFHIREVRHARAVLPFRWSAVQYAPQFARWPE
jgi:predicted pyridoxine 5'-phosphate oxidase superfamily flavin-nucleotide-binding protein